MAKVSVIIPCYNAHDCIKRCLDSLQNQIFNDFEVVLVNDCSTDETVREITDWKKKHKLNIKLISNTLNSGPSKSRYNGAIASDSEWIAFCDSDDWYEDTFLDRMLSTAEKNDCDIVFCGYQNVIGDKIDKHPLSESEKVLSPRDAMYLNVDSLCMTLVKRQIFINTEQPDIRNGEDMALVPLMIQKATKVGVLNDVLYNYFIRLGSASLTPNDNMINSLIKSFEHIDRNIDDRYMSEKEFLGVRNLIYGGLLNLFKFSYNTDKANQILRSFEDKYPLWISNRGISNLPLFKRLYVKCAKLRLYPVTYLLSRVHSFMLK